jgi:putative acetyltransferase
MTFTIRLEDPGQAEVLKMLEAGEAYMAGLYPAESNHILPLEALRAPDVRFVVARNEAGIAVGTGAIVLNDGWAEIKRMWIQPDARGVGLSRKILSTLEMYGREAGVAALRLETGIENHEALALYERTGYVRIKAFGDYWDDPLSVFMEKRIDL